MSHHKRIRDVDNDMNEQDYELLSQFVDGELSTIDAQALRKRLMAEPRLRASLEQLRAVNDSVVQVFDVPAASAVPERVTSMLENAKTRGASRPEQHRAVWGFAIAASLVAATGLLLNPDWRQSSDGYPAGATGTDAPLARLLEQTPSRGQHWDTLPDGRQVRPLLSFQDKSGGWCREYLLSSAGSTWRGVACRGEGNWATEVLSPEQHMEPGSEYRPAGAASSSHVDSYISSHAAGIALSLQQEAALIANKWQ